MNELVSIQNGTAVASSLVLAEGTDNEHRAVLQLIRENLADFEEFGRVASEMQPFMTAGGQQVRTVFLLNEDQAILLITYLRNNELVRGFKIRLVKAFRALVNRAHEDVPGPAQVWLSASRTEILRLALTMSEERDALKMQAVQHQATIATLEPKAKALDRISNATGLHCITDVAKVLRMKPSTLFDWLSKQNWIYRRPNGGAWIAYQDRVDGGWLVNKVATISREDLPDKVVDRLLVTPKGLAHLGQLIAKGA